MQTKRTLENVRKIVEASGYRLSNIVKCSRFLQDLGDSATFNQVYANYFAISLPAKERVEMYSYR